MKRFFFLRSSAPDSENSNATPVKNSKKKDANMSDSNKIYKNSRSPKEKVLRPCNLCPESDNSSQPQLRRSLSFSSTMSYGGGEGQHLNLLNEFSQTPPNCSCAADSASSYQSYTPEKVTQRSRDNNIAVEKLSEADDSEPSSSRYCHHSSGKSSRCSPTPLTCRNDRLTTTSKKAEILDLYVDGEHQAIKSNQNSSCNTSAALDDTHLADKHFLQRLGKPPRVKLATLHLPDYDKENLHKYSFSEEHNAHDHCSNRDWTEDGLTLASVFKQNRNSEKLSQAFVGQCSASRDYDSATTTTIDDVFDNSSDIQTSFNPKCVPEVHVSGFTLSYEKMKAGTTDESLTVPTKQRLPENTLTVIDVKLDKLQEQATDEELLRMVHEMQEKFIALSEENPQMQNYLVKGLNATEVLQMIKNINEDKKRLVLEISSQIKFRLSERFASKEQLKQSKMELENRTRRLEKEKDELQLSLEKELDRRSNDWSLKLSKFQSEEQRLRERVRELAEQNVSLQREVSSLKASEMEAQNRALNREKQVSDLNIRMEEERNENLSLQQSLSELHNKLNVVEEDHFFLKKIFRDREKEITQLEKVAVQLQRKGNEQEKTITGLRQGYGANLSHITLEGDKLSRLQLEQLRLTGVEMTLRREVESCKFEIESLRCENLSILDRLRGIEEGHNFSFLRLDQELHARVDYLQNQAISLLHDHSHFCSKLLESIKCKDYGNRKVLDSEPDGYSVTDYILEYQSLKRGTESLKRRLQDTISLLDKKSNLETSHSHRWPSEDNKTWQLKDQRPEKPMDFNLKTEAILSEVLKEKLYFKEMELEELRADLASLIMTHDVLQTTKERLQDEVSCLTHRIKEMEFQIAKKDDTISQLQLNIKESMEDLSTLQGILRKVSEERDGKLEEVNQLRETNKIMGNEVCSFRRKIETLDEDILLREGQISILRDSWTALLKQYTVPR